MLKLIPNLIPIGGIAWWAAAEMSRLLTPVLLAPQLDDRQVTPLLDDQRLEAAIEECLLGEDTETEPMEAGPPHRLNVASLVGDRVLSQNPMNRILVPSHD